MALAHITDHVARALADLVSQYQGSASFTGLASVATAEHQTLEDVLWDAFTESLDFTPSPNLLASSSAFDNSAWTKTTGVTVTPNAVVAPDGSMTADRVAYDGTGAAGLTRLSNSTGLTVVNGQQYATSLWFRADAPVTLALSLNRPSSGPQVTTCVLTTSWQRFSNIDLGDGVRNAILNVLSPNGVNTPFTIYAWGAQLEVGASATDYQPKEGEFTRAFLDVLGKIVGQPRGSFDDLTYRMWLKARMRVNRSGGTGADLAAIFGALLLPAGASFALEEWFPAAVLVRYAGLDIPNPTALRDVLRQAKAAGVRAHFVGTNDVPANSFTLDVGPGLDVGKLADEYE